ncbi:MAG: hypothetical protein ABL984_12025 [Pyrinomonadaceae bacterium]
MKFSDVTKDSPYFINRRVGSVLAYVEERLLPEHVAKRILRRVEKAKEGKISATNCGRSCRKRAVWRISSSPTRHS